MTIIYFCLRKNHQNRRKWIFTKCSASRLTTHGVTILNNNKQDSGRSGCPAADHRCKSRDTSSGRCLDRNLGRCWGVNQWGVSIFGSKIDGWHCRWRNSSKRWWCCRRWHSFGGGWSWDCRGGSSRICNRDRELHAVATMTKCTTNEVMSTRRLESDGCSASAIATNGIASHAWVIVTPTHFIHSVPTSIIEHCPSKTYKRKSNHYIFRKVIKRNFKTGLT